MVSIHPGSRDADVNSYNCSAPPNTLLVEVDCHWLDETTVPCCSIQLIRALWLPPPGPPPPEPLIKKDFTAPLLTSAASWVVVKMVSLPENPPNANTGLLVARIMASASFELTTATRYFELPWCASSYLMSAVCLDPSGMVAFPHSNFGKPGNQTAARGLFSAHPPYPKEKNSASHGSRIVTDDHWLRCTTWTH